LGRRHPDKIDLNDPETLDRTIEEYLSECETLGQLPSIEGFSVFARLSRRWVYEFLERHRDTRSGDMLEWLQTLCAAAKIAANEAGSLSDASMIFCLKNAGLGFADKIEITPAAPANPLHDLDAEQARKRLLDAIPDEDDP